MGAGKKTKDRKKELWAALQDACNTYTKCMFVNTDNVTSKQISVMRQDMRKMNAVLICGKNTMMKAAITELNTEPEEGEEDYEARKAAFVHRPHLDKIVSMLKGNTSIIFTNKELIDLQKVLDSQVREAPARIGSLAPKDVVIKAGPTGLDPRQTSFFGNLGIATKIVKAAVEILNDFTIIKEGDKITPGQSALLDKLKIRPFEYKMTIKKVLLEGQIYDSAVLNITEDDVRAKFSSGCGLLTALSLGSGYMTAAAAPHLIMNAFKNLAAVSFATEYSFKQATDLKNAAASAVAAPVAVVKTEAKVEKKESVKEESSDGCIGFGGDDDEEGGGFGLFDE